MLDNGCARSSFHLDVEGPFAQYEPGRLAPCLVAPPFGAEFVDL
jgi:hypothetical protein